MCWAAVIRLPLLVVLLRMLVVSAEPEACSLANRRACQAPQETETGPLLLSVSVPDVVVNPNALPVTTTLVNTGSKTLRIFKDPNSPISPHKTHSFDFYKITKFSTKPSNASCPDVSPSDGVIWYDYDPYEAANYTSKDAYIVLRPKEKKRFVKDISGIYMFDTPGLYTVQVTPNARYFAIMTGRNSVDFTQARIAEGPAADKAASFAVRMSAVNRQTGVAKRATRTNYLDNWQTQPIFRQCTAAQKREIKATIRATRQMLRGVNRFLSDNGSVRSSRWLRWFGEPSRKNWNFVRNNYLSIGAEPTSYRYDCTCTACDRSAFTDPKPSDRTPTIYLCKKFWWAPRTGPESKAGLLIREATHFEFLAKVKEYAIGIEDAYRLAINYPSRAIYNTGSYRFFAEDAYVSRDSDFDFDSDSTIETKSLRSSRYRPSSSRYRSPKYRKARYRDSRRQGSKHCTTKVTTTTNRSTNYRPMRYRLYWYRPFGFPRWQRTAQTYNFGSRPVHGHDKTVTRTSTCTTTSPGSASRRPAYRRPKNRRPAHHVSNKHRSGSYISENRRPGTKSRRPKDRRPKRPASEDDWQYEDAWSPDPVKPSRKSGSSKNRRPTNRRPESYDSDADSYYGDSRFSDDTRPVRTGDSPSYRHSTDRRPTDRYPKDDWDHSDARIPERAKYGKSGSPKYSGSKKPSVKVSSPRIGSPTSGTPNDRYAKHDPEDGLRHDDSAPFSNFKPSGKGSPRIDRRPTDRLPAQDDAWDRHSGYNSPSGKGSPKASRPSDRHSKQRPGTDWDHEDVRMPDHTSPSGKGGRTKDKAPADRYSNDDWNRHSGYESPVGKDGHPKASRPSDRHSKDRPGAEWDNEGARVPDYSSPSGKSGRPKAKAPADRHSGQYFDDEIPSGKGGSPKASRPDNRHSKDRPGAEWDNEEARIPDYGNPSGKGGQSKVKAPADRHSGGDRSQYSDDEIPPGKGGSPKASRPADRHSKDRPTTDWDYGNSGGPKSPSGQGTRPKGKTSADGRPTHRDPGDDWDQYSGYESPSGKGGRPKDNHPGDHHSKDRPGAGWDDEDSRIPAHENPTGKKGQPKAKPPVDHRPTDRDAWDDWDKSGQPDGSWSPGKGARPENGRPKDKNPTDRYPTQGDDWGDESWYPDDARRPGREGYPKNGHSGNRHPDYSENDDWPYHNPELPYEGGAPKNRLNGTPNRTPNRTPGRTPNGTPHKAPKMGHPDPSILDDPRLYDTAKPFEQNRNPKHSALDDDWDDDPWYDDNTQRFGKERYPRKNDPLSEEVHPSIKDGDPVRAPDFQAPTGKDSKLPSTTDDWEGEPRYPKNAGLPGQDNNTLGNPKNSQSNPPLVNDPLRLKPNSNQPLPPADDDWEDDSWRPEDSWNPDDAGAWDENYDRDTAPIYSGPEVPSGDNLPNNGDRSPDGARAYANENDW